MYYLLTQSFKSQEEKLVELIKEAVPIEKIYMLGSTLIQRRTESVFMTDAPSCRNVSHYWLLVLIDKDCGHSINYIQDKIENTCLHFVPVTAIVLDTAQFNNWLNEGQRFACTVIKIAVLIHDNNIPLVIPNTINEETDEKTTSIYFTQGINKVNEFIAGAELFRLREQNKMAAFMLHQATEQALLTIFKKATGLRISSHNIDKLLRYCAMVDYKIPEIFPKEGESNNKRFFELLQRAYIDARYKEDFRISNAEITILTERVKALQDIMLDKSSL